MITIQWQETPEHSQWMLGLKKNDDGSVDMSSCRNPCSPCWCANHAHAACCRTNVVVPINNGIWMLVLTGIILGMIKLKKMMK